MANAAPLFRFEPIDSETLARAAYPLVHSVRKGLSLNQWRRQVNALRRKGHAGLECGYMAVVSARGAVLAIFAFAIESMKTDTCKTEHTDEAGTDSDGARNRRRLIISEVIGCHLPGFDPEALLAQERQRLAARCRCDEVTQGIVPIPLSG